MVKLAANRFCSGLLLASLALATALALNASPASAQSTACLRLTNELAALSSGGGFSPGANSPKAKQYDRAIRDQKAQIAKTERASRQNNCRGGGGFFGNAAGLCQRIGTSLKQMYGNLESLQATYSQLAAGGGKNSSGRRAAILAEMSANGCDGRIRQERASIHDQAPRARNLLEQIFGVNTYREDGSRSGKDYQPDAQLSSRYGTFRTLCVRTCDGYYFPISFSTVPDHFPQDEQSCQSMCPGTDVSLYFHAMPAQDSEDMISYRTEEPYAQLPNAFSYRKSVNNSCACRAARTGFAEIAGGGAVKQVTMESRKAGTVPLPVWRVDPGIDPEAAANANGNLTLEALERMARRDEIPLAVSPSNRTIRIVGPAFFPVQ